MLCDVCVCRCGIWVLCGVYVIVWGMGVVGCVCRCGVWVLCDVCVGVGYGCCVVCTSVQVSWVCICMHVLVCPYSCYSGLCLRLNTCIHVHMTAMCVMYYNDF